MFTYNAGVATVRTRLDAGQRREQIARAALGLLGEHGLAGVSTEALAQAVGVTPGALYRHFPSLAAVFAAAVEEAVERLEASFPAAALPPLERLLRLAERRVALIAEEPGLLWMLRSDQACRELPASAVAPLRVIAARSRRFLLEALREGAADGSIRSDLAPEILLVPVVGTIQTLLGAPGLHGSAAGARAPSPRAVLRGLRRLLAPPPPPRAATRKPNPSR